MTQREIINAAIHAQEQRIVELQRLRDAVQANMDSCVDQILDDLIEVYSVRQLARKLERSPRFIDDLANFRMACSYELYLELFDLWRKLQKKAK